MRHKIIYENHGKFHKIRTHNIIATFTLLDTHGYKVISIGGKELKVG